MPKYKIIVIEDDEALSQMYYLKLSDTGYQVEKAITGEAGLKKMKKQAFDLILLDIILPNLGGWQVLKKIRADKKNPNNATPVILLTNLGDKESIKKGDDMDVDNYLIKAHFTPQEVVNKIEEVLKDKNKKINEF